MLRVRFYVPFDECKGDYRPVKWPIKYPYWCTGENLSEFILVAYVDSMDELKELWPEAINAEAKECDEIVFSGRFPKPDWYEPKEKKDEH